MNASVRQTRQTHQSSRTFFRFSMWSEHAMRRCGACVFHEQATFFFFFSFSICSHWKSTLAPHWIRLTFYVIRMEIFDFDTEIKYHVKFHVQFDLILGRILCTKIQRKIKRRKYWAWNDWENAGSHFVCELHTRTLFISFFLSTVFRSPKSVSFVRSALRSFVSFVQFVVS